MRTLIKYMTLLLVGGVIIPVCHLLAAKDTGTKAHENNCHGLILDNAPEPSVTYVVAAKILPVLHFFQ